MNNPDTLEELLNVYPFIMKNSNLKITQEIIYDLYLNSNSFTQDIDKYKFPDNSTEDYLIKFSKKNEAIVIKIYKEQNLLLPIGDILPKPYSILVEGDPKLKKFYIFKENNYIKLITFMNGKKDKYSYTEDKSNKTIKIQIKKYFISSENINEMLACKNNIMVKKEDLPNLNAKIVEIDPLNLSLNFYTIYNEVEETKKFEFLLNKERIDFLKFETEYCSKIDSLAALPRAALNLGSAYKLDNDCAAPSTSGSAHFSAAEYSLLSDAPIFTIL